MRKIREGNDIYVSWSIYDVDGNPYVLTGKDLKVFLDSTKSTNPRFHVPVVTSIEITEFSILDNVISFCYYGRQQNDLTGEYALRFIENDGTNGMVTFDARNAFEIVEHSWQEEQGEVTTIETEYVSLASVMQTQPYMQHQYLSLERMRKYLYKVTFDSLSKDDGGDSSIYGACSSFVHNGKLYRNLDFNYDNTADFIVRTADFEGMSFITGLNDGELKDSLISQLPYRVVDGRNNDGIMVSTHVLFNDWQWTGAGEKSISLTRLPYLVLSKVKSMETIASDLDGILDNLYASEGLQTTGYLLQLLVTDGTTSYAILPPINEGEGYVLQDITSNPKMANFRWVNRSVVERNESDIQARPTGIERWNMMPCSLSDLRFTIAYEQAGRLSEFIGIDDTTKDSADEELESIYERARALYFDRQRDGMTWHTVHSVVYGYNMESLHIQENWNDEIAIHASPPL